MQRYLIVYFYCRLGFNVTTKKDLGLPRSFFVLPIDSILVLFCALETPKLLKQTRFLR